MAQSFLEAVMVELGQGVRSPFVEGAEVRIRLEPAVELAEGGEVCSCDLEVPLGKSQPTISHHTKALADAGLLAGEKRGRWMMWRVVPERLAALRAALS